MKLCKCCRRTKSPDEFYGHKSTADRLQATCKDCHRRRTNYNCSQRSKETRRRYNLNARFGLTLEQYDEMVRAQGGRCLICRAMPDVLRVDHDHKTGLVRGLLCHQCNCALGLVYESLPIVDGLAAYIQERCN